MMPRRFLAAALLAASSWPAAAATSSGPGALALAGVVGLQDPSATPAQKQALLALLNGEPRKVEKTPAFTITATSVVCRASNVAISTHSCDLAFDAQSVSVTGRAAHEIYATGIENGIQPGVGAGSLYVTLNSLKCTIDPAQIAQAAGGGATCEFKPPQ